MGTSIDLRHLERPASPVPLRSRRRLLTRYVAPLLLLGGFAVFLLMALRDRLSPPRSVTVVPVLTSRGELRQAEGATLFRAAGWIEPRPSPIVVTAHAEGVVDRLLVVEGQAIKKGEMVARLVTADAALAVETAAAELQLREAEYLGARANLAASRTRLDNPVHLEADLAEADSALARIEAERDSLPSLLKAAEARLRTARLDWDGKRRGDVAPEVVVERARSELDSAAAAADGLQSRQKRLPVEIDALERKRRAMKNRLAWKTEEVRQEAVARAAVQTALAGMRQAAAALTVARLRLGRMDIHAPASGTVLAVLARPGTRLGGLNSGASHDTSSIATLYDPALLQVRVDVRLEDVGKVRQGQEARIESAALAGRVLKGAVLFATAQADVQKNTLSIKVGVSDPPPLLRPDMLCQVTFLAPPSVVAPSDTGPTRLLVPRQLVETSGDEGRVWVADQADGKARRRTVRLGTAIGDLIEVLLGLTAADKLIVGGRDGLAEGDRIRIVGEDDTLGIQR